jgi:hypothetical protein
LVHPCCDAVDENVLRNNVGYGNATLLPSKVSTTLL